MFASKVTKVIEHEGALITIRKLSAKSLDKARQARSIAQAEQLRAYGGDLMRAFREAPVEDVAEVVKARTASAEARYEPFDRDTVLQAGIASWTSEEKLTPQAIADLDEETANKLFHEIIDLSAPAPAVAAATEGNA